MAATIALPWHAGESRIHKLLSTPSEDNPTSPTLTPFANLLLQHSPLLAIGTLDSLGRPWTTLWGGDAGFSGSLGGAVIGVRAEVDGLHDPVVRALTEGGGGKGGTSGNGGGGERKMVGGLAIDLMARRRVKLFGRLLAGKLDDDAGDFQMAVGIEQSLGNCPKYINKKHIVPHIPSPVLVSHSGSAGQLLPEALSLIAKADLFFISSSNGTKDMDTNHRGGPPGFVRAVPPAKPGGAYQLIYPEYSGNRLYQTLGNLIATPRAGLVFPDFETSDVLYVTGTAEILIGAAATAVMSRTKLAVRITIEEAVFVRDGLSFRGDEVEAQVEKGRSPYNPRVRMLVSEQNRALPSASSELSAAGNQSATLISKTTITPTVTRYLFRLSTPSGQYQRLCYKPGQWVALDFSQELDMGYSHMRDDDPTSINDDFVRTFTVSSAPPPEQDASNDEISKEGDDEFEITARTTGGAVTRFLSTQHPRVGLSVPILGFGGEFSIPDSTPAVIFIAGGVGITPLLAHLPAIFHATHQELKVLWTLHQKDVAFAQDVLRSFPALAKSLHLFVTGTSRPGPRASDSASADGSNDLEAATSRLRDAGASVQFGRMSVQDVRDVENVIVRDGGAGTGGVPRLKYFVCANPKLTADVQKWVQAADKNDGQLANDGRDGEGRPLPTREVIVEGFDF